MRYYVISCTVFSFFHVNYWTMYILPLYLIELFIFLLNLFSTSALYKRNISKVLSLFLSKNILIYLE